MFDEYNYACSQSSTKEVKEMSANRPSSDVLHVDQSSIRQVREMPSPLMQESNFRVKFELDEAYVEYLTDLDYPYFKLKDDRTTELRATLYLRNKIKDMKITLVVLQGNQRVNLGLANQASWHPALVIPLPNHTNQEIDVKLEWDPNGSEEIIIFPIVDRLGNYYDGSTQGVIRLFVGKHQDYHFTASTLKEHAIEGDAHSSALPAFSWLTPNNTPIEVDVYTSDDRGYANEPYNKLEFQEITHPTSVDILYLNTRKDARVLMEHVPLPANQKNIVELPHQNMQEWQKATEDRHYILVLNHRGDNILKDYVAVKQKLKVASTNFQQVIEVYPYKRNP